MYYPGPLRILKNELLSAEEAEVEARFAAQVQTRLDAVLHREVDPVQGAGSDTHTEKETHQLHGRKSRHHRRTPSARH